MLKNGRLANYNKHTNTWNKNRKEDTLVRLWHRFGGRGAEDALIVYTVSIKNKNKQGLFVEFKKAFDIFNHNIGYHFQN